MSGFHVEIDDDRNFYTVKEIAPMFLVTGYTVREWIKTGQLRAGKIGRMYLVYPQDLRRFCIEKFGFEPEPEQEDENQLELFSEPVDEERYAEMSKPLPAPEETPEEPQETKEILEDGSGTLEEEDQPEGAARTHIVSEGSLVDPESPSKTITANPVQFWPN